MSDIALRDLAVDCAKRKELVEACVKRCQYRCCGGGWHDRGEGTYVGTLISVDDGSALLQCQNNLRGKMAEVIFDLDDVLALRSVD